MGGNTIGRAKVTPCGSMVFGQKKEASQAAVCLPLEMLQVAILRGRLQT